MDQATLPHTTSPALVPAPAEYIPYLFVDRRRSTYIPELTAADRTLAGVVSDIATGQHEDVDRVMAVDLISGQMFDASKEVAYLVLDRVLDEGYEDLPPWCADFIEHHLGAGFIAQALREVA